MNKKISIVLFIIFVIASLLFITSYLIKDTKRINSNYTFSKIGNLSFEANQWKIVYDEPGSPALVKYLILEKNSQCFDKPCSENILSIGDRVEVKGFLEDNYVYVASIEKIHNLQKNDNSLIFDDSFKDNICLDYCGNGTCEEIVCLGENCPCAENTSNCPADCL